MEDDGLYQLNQQKPFLTVDSNIWHKRLVHLNQQSMVKLLSMADGIVLKKEALQDCIASLQGKHARDKFRSSSEDLVHSDVCGPVEVPSLGGSRFFITFMDDATRKVFVYCLESKGQVTEAYEQFKSPVERQTGKKLKILQTDNGTEYVNSRMRKSMQRDGIVHQTSCPYTPQLNGVAERMNRTLVEKVRCMLNDAQLLKKFWAEVFSTAAYLVNRSDMVTPEEAWSKPVLPKLFQLSPP